MKRRLFLLGSLGLIAGCATAPNAPVDVGRIDTPVAPLPPSTPPPPVPPAPPDMASFLTGPDPVLTPTGDAAFDAYVQKVLNEGGLGWRPYLLRVLQGVRPDPRVLAAHDAERAGWITSAPAYVGAMVTPDRVAEGRRQVASNQALIRIARERRIPPEVLAAYWGVASNYGRERGEFDLITTVMTLGAHGRGRFFWLWDIYYATEMIARGRVSRAEAKSFADGSMGQLRWHPEWYLERAIDGDGDGKVDIWRSPPDVLASIGAILARGWEPDQPWLYQVQDPLLNPADPYARERGDSWRLGDLRPAGSRAWTQAEANTQVQIIRPAGGAVYAAARNFWPLAYSSGVVHYTDETESQLWGIAVGMLANAIRGT